MTQAKTVFTFIFIISILALASSLSAVSKFVFHATPPVVGYPLSDWEIQANSPIAYDHKPCATATRSFARSLSPSKFSQFLSCP